MIQQKYRGKTIKILRHKKTWIAATAFAAIAITALFLSTSNATDFALRGANLFNDEHAYSRTLLRFGQLVNEQANQEIKFDLRGNSELGIEPDYINFLTQGVAIDYAIIAPSNLARFVPSFPLIGMPFLFRDLDHWNAVLSSDALKPLEDELLAKADLIIIGYTGGGTRNLISNKKITNIGELNGHRMRVMAAPVQTRIFQSVSAVPSAINYSEIYYAIKTGVIDGLENESASLQQYKFFEVAPHITLTEHSITVRLLLMSGKSFRRLPKDIQSFIMKAGKEAAAYGRALESSEDSDRLEYMQKAGQIEIHDFTGREQFLDLAIPVQDAYAKELGAQELLQSIRAM